jgi:HK97 family phage prohead protease
MIRFTSSTFSVDAAQDGSPKRTITGIALPYNVEATVSGGQVVSFLPGSLPTDGKAPKLYMSHDASQAIGLVTERADSPEAMYFTAKVSTTALGDEALILAADGVLDSVSVGVNPTKFSYNEEGVMIVEAADWQELSLVPQPAFSGATITDVAASIPTSDEEISDNTKEEADTPKPIEPQENPVSETPAPEVIEASSVFAQPKREFAMPTPGEFMAAYHIGGDTFRKVNEAVKAAAAKNQTALQAASAENLTTDTPGLLSNVVLGPVFQNYNFIRPVVSGIGVRAMPGAPSKSFIRPIITQHTSAAVQTEGDQVESQKMTLSANTVTKSTVAGSIFISQQDMDFTSPEAMGTILNDLSGQYMKVTDTIACTALNANKQTSGFTWTVTAGDPTGLMNALYGCAFNISSSTNLFATHLIVSVDVWQKLGSQLDADKRPLFPAIGAPGLIGQNTLGAGSAASWSGMNPMGLEILVDGNLAAGTMLVVHAPAVELYEQVRGIMSVDNPDLLGRTFTYYGYFATFFQDATDATAGSRFVQAVTVA